MKPLLFFKVSSFARFISYFNMYCFALNFPKW